jgi:ABC-type Fe3+ transport system substrate-binding protein
MKKVAGLKTTLRGSVLVLLLGTIAVLVAACGSDPTPTPVPAATPTPDPDTIVPQWQLDYNDVLEAAKAEGEVVIVMGGSASRNFGPRFEAFEQDTGIKVLAVTGRGSAQVEKFKAEREAGLFTADVWMTGVTSTNNARAAGIVGPFPSDHFIDPVVAPENWVDGKHWFADSPNRDTTLAFCASPSTQFAVNTDLVDISTLDSYWDLIDGRFDGQIVGTIPWEPGQTNSDFYINVPALGEEFIRKIVLDSNVEWVADGQQAVDLLANGVKSVFVYQGNANADIDDLADEGLPVLNHFGQGFAEGGVVSIGGTCALAMFNNPANENARKIFVNWWLNPENLHAAQGITDDQSLHTSVLTNNLGDQYIRGDEFFFPEMQDDIVANVGLEFNRKIAEEAGLR